MQHLQMEGSPIPHMRGNQIGPVLLRKIEDKGAWNLGYSDNYLFPDIT